MRIRSITTLIIAAALLTLGAIAAACGSADDALSLEDYLAELDSLDTQYEERTDTLETTFDEDSALVASDVNAVLALFQGFFDEGAQAVREFVNGIDALNPPPEAQEIHNRAVTAGRALVAAFDDLQDKLQDVTSEAGFNAAFESFEAASEGDEFSQACEDMQALADTNDIEVTFSCVE